MNFRSQYVDLVERHTGKPPGEADASTLEELAACEQRLGVRLPNSLREYYLTAGRLDAMNRSHNRLLRPDELRVEDGHLVFMEENQAVVLWGVPVGSLSTEDPVVRQRANVDGAQWYAEDFAFSEFVVRMLDWQRGFADAPG